MKVVLWEDGARSGGGSLGTGNAEPYRVVVTAPCLPLLKAGDKGDMGKLRAAHLAGLLLARATWAPLLPTQNCPCHPLAAGDNGGSVSCPKPGGVDALSPTKATAPCHHQQWESKKKA